jgi:hypothetical protein
MISVANRVIAIWYITMSLRCGEQKRQNPGRVHDSRRNEKIAFTVYQALCEKRFAGMLLEGKQAHTA